MNGEEGHLFDIGDTSLYIVERGSGYPLIVLHGEPGSRFLMSHVEHQLANFEPEELRQQVTDSWAQKPHVQNQDEMAALMSGQLPFHFADPYDSRIAEYEQYTAETVYSPEVLRKFSVEDYGGIEVEDRLAAIPQPVLVLAGRHDRTCSVEAAEFMAANIPQAKLVVFEQSAHMTFWKKMRTM